MSVGKGRSMGKVQTGSGRAVVLGMCRTCYGDDFRNVARDTEKFIEQLPSGEMTAFVSAEPEYESAWPSSA